jgi:hypothetical protein
VDPLDSASEVKVSGITDPEPLSLEVGPATGHGSELVELASGVDMLVVSGRATIPAGILDELDLLRTAAHEQGAPSPISLGDTEFGVAGYGWGNYRYRLEHSRCLVGLTGSRAFPSLRVQVRSSFLHGVGTEEALSWITERLGVWIGPILWTISRIHLHADWQGWNLGTGDGDQFASRARDRVTYQSNGAWTGFAFGARSTQTIVARIYDKSAEIVKTGASFWPLVWGDAFDSARHVERVEF